METYYQHPAISASFLKEFIKSPMKAKLSRETQSIETEALIFGRIFHQSMEGKAEYMVFDPANKPDPSMTFAGARNKAWKESFYQQYPEALTVDQAIQLKKMVNAVKASEFYNNLLTVPFKGAESEYYTELPIGSVKCKPDALYEGADGSLICVDWKTTAESLTTSASNVKRILNKFNYGIQAVHYTEILRHVTGREVNFIFVFVEKSEPFEVLPVWVNREGEYYNYWFEIWRDAVEEADKAIKTGMYKTLEQLCKIVEV